MLSQRISISWISELWRHSRSPLKLDESRGLNYSRRAKTSGYKKPFPNRRMRLTTWKRFSLRLTKSGKFPHPFRGPRRGGDHQNIWPRKQNSWKSWRNFLFYSFSPTESEWKLISFRRIDKSKEKLTEVLFEHSKMGTMAVTQQCWIRNCLFMTAARWGWGESRAS